MLSLKLVSIGSMKKTHNALLEDHLASVTTSKSTIKQLHAILPKIYKYKIKDQQFLVKENFFFTEKLFPVETADDIINYKGKLILLSPIKITDMKTKVRDFEGSIKIKADFRGQELVLSASLEGTSTIYGVRNGFHEDNFGCFKKLYKKNAHMYIIGDVNENGTVIIQHFGGLKGLFGHSK